MLFAAFYLRQGGKILLPRRQRGCHPNMAAAADQADQQPQEGRCLGRLVRNDPKGVWMLPLEEAGAIKNWFHIPYRCEKRSIKDGLCEFCIAKERRTEERVEEAAGGMIKRGLHSGLLHGRVGDPVPPWSRIFGGEWYNLKLAAGCTVSEETMARAKKAVAETGGVGVAVPMPPLEGAPVPVKAAKKPGRKPKMVAEATEAPAVAAGPVQTKLSLAELRAAAAAQKAAAAVAAPVAEKVEAAVAAPAPAAPPKKIAPKKTGARKAEAAAAAAAPLEIATAFVEQTAESPVEDVVEIKVRRLELDGGRTYYLDSKKQKLYDMKFKYVGRYSAEKGEVDRSFPDSDNEA